MFRRIGVLVIGAAASVAGYRALDREEQKSVLKPIEVEQTREIVHAVEDELKHTLKKYETPKQVQESKKEIIEDVCSKMLEKRRDDCKFIMEEFYDSFVSGSADIKTEDITKSRIENILKKK